MTKNYLQVALASIEESYQRNLEYAAKNRDEYIRNAEKQAQILPVLQDAGFLQDKESLSRFGYPLTIDLGTDTSKLPLLRQLLGKWEFGGKDVADGMGRKRYVKLTLKCKEWPVHVTYAKPIPKKSKCKIKTVRSTYRTLVCE